MYNRREFLKDAAAMTAVTGGALAQRQPPPRRPNVIILLTDDQGYGDFSCHGNPVLQTPAMDRLHAESVRFTSFHSAPMCTPTRSQLLTGQDALRNGATSVTAGRAIIRRGIPLLPEAFRAAGYATGLFGKWHVGDTYPYRPMDRGFQVAKYFKGWGLQSAPEFGNDYFDGTYLDNGAPKRFDGYCTDFWFREAMTWMAASADRQEPFFCYLPTNTPHGPAWVDRKYSEPYNKPGLPKDFFGMIANLDENIAKLEDFLKARALRDDTIFLFMTDNGATAGFNFYNAGMRGRKTQNYEGGHRVPCFVRWPDGKLRAPGDIATPAQMQDLFPTLIDLCRLPKPATAAFDGTSLAPVLRGATNAAPPAKLASRMFVVQYGQIPKKWDGCTIWGKWRLVGENELYDMSADPAQKSSVAEANPKVLAAMRAHYEKWWAGVEPKLTDWAPITIGSPKENPVTLTCSDWQDIYCDNVGHVSTAAGGPRGGPWSVWVELDGDYEIRARRWPESTGLALDAPGPEQKMRVGKVPAGKALPVAKAELRIAGQEARTDTPAGAKEAVFRVRLKGGQKSQMQAWFQNSAGMDLCGAFYCYVRRV